MKSWAPGFVGDWTEWAVKFLKNSKIELENLVFKWGFHILEAKEEAAEEEEQNRLNDENVVKATNELKKTWMD